MLFGQSLVGGLGTARQMSIEFANAVAPGRQAIAAIDDIDQGSQIGSRDGDTIVQMMGKALSGAIPILDWREHIDGSPTR